MCFRGSFVLQATINLKEHSRHETIILSGELLTLPRIPTYGKGAVCAAAFLSYAQRHRGPGQKGDPVSRRRYLYWPVIPSLGSQGSAVLPDKAGGYIVTSGKFVAVRAFNS